MSFTPSPSLVLAAALFLSIRPCGAMLDQDGDGMADLWQQMHAGATTGRDLDGDGFPDEAEAVAGTNPGDRASRLAFTEYGQTGGHAFFRWHGIAGKNYGVERLDPQSGTWSEAGNRVVATSGPQELEFASPESSGIFRLRVTDRDLDGDGLSAWEEILLGLSDASATSSAQTGRHDYAAAFRMLEGSGTLNLTGGQGVPRRPAKRAEVARFLVQSSFGADGLLIDQVTAQGIGAWLDAQFAAPATSTYDTMWAQYPPIVPDAFFWRKGWWRSVMLGEDQVRQRMAFALSQIFVITCESGSLLGDNALLQARYYDLLGNGAFGSYRDVLRNVTYSAQMGLYLSHLRNRKSDIALNRFPDENFAREIMQLFSIGLWELNPDGSRKLDPQGNAIPTYDNAIITEMAKVFTGLSFTLNNGTPNGSFFTGGRGNDYIAPMKMFDDEHEPGEKHILSDVDIPSGQTGDEDISDALDALCAHPNIAPFISRLLIQRFTSSNPSPDYVRRVAAVWNDNGAGVRGNLKAVTEAILLDPEARTPEARGDASGKVREPILRVVGLLRAFKARNASNTFPLVSNEMTEFFGQFPLLSPSVFNFYSPEHRPLGELRNRGLVAPELEIATTSRLLLTDNRLRSAIDTDFYTLQLDLAGAIALAGDTDVLLDHLDGLLTWGRMSPATRATVKTAANAQTNATEKVKTAIHLIIDSPDYAVLK